MRAAPRVSADHALSAEGLVRRFGALTAVRDVTLRVAHGERRAVLGANGAGKTTLFNLIAGDLRPTSGRILLFGEDITRLPANRRVHKGLHRTYQKSLVFAGLSARENLFVAVRGVRGRHFSIASKAACGDEMAEVEDLAARLHLIGVLECPAGELSHGEQRQLELAMALAGKPRVLLLDEPAAGLSPSERQALLAMIRALPRDLTLVMIEHDMDIALSSVDLVTVMHNGDVLAEGTPAAIAANQKVHDIYMGQNVS